MLGDPDRWPEIWEANRSRLKAAGHTDSGVLQIGWILELPRDDSEPEPEAASSSPTYTVEPGDNFWTIAAYQLHTAWGREPTTAEVAPYWVEVVDRNQEDLVRPGDSDLIYPGQTFTLPEPPPNPEGPTGRSTSGTASEDPVAPPPEREPAIEPPTGDLGATDMSDDQNTTADDSAGSSDTATTGPLHPDHEAELPGASDEQPTEDDEEPAEDDEEARSWFSSRQIGVTALLASLTLAVLARRRKARRRGYRPDPEPRPPDEEDIDTQLALNAAADVVAPAQTAAKALGIAFRALDDPPIVTGLVVSHGGHVTVHLSEAVAPVAPFTSDAAASAGASRPPTTRSSPPWKRPRLSCGPLVTLGSTPDGDWVLVDLESLGALEIDGPPEHATGMLRSIAAELSAQPLDHLLSLTVAGVDLLGETGQGVQVDALDEDIVRTAESSGANTAACLEEFDVALTTTARANGLPGEEFVVDVVVAGGDADSDLVNRLAETSLPGSRGTALVTTCPLGPEARRIILADGRAQIPHLGLTVDAANLGRSDLERMNRMLRNEPDGTPSPGDLRPPTAVVGDGSGDAIDRAPGPNRQWPTLTDVPDATSPQWRCCVRVFAGHLVEDSEGELLSFRYGENPDVPHKNTHRGPELISYLALSGREATRDRIRDDLWWDRSVRTETVQKTIHGTRKVLGGPDLLSRADGKPYRYRLADEVVTDVELLEHAVHQARSLADSPDGWSEMLDVLRPHFLRIEAPAFHDDAMGRGLAEWAAAHRIVDRVERPLVEAALLVAHHADDQPDRIPAALWAIDQALIACPTNEPLIRAAMNLEAEVGDRASAESRYHALATQLAKDDLDPEPETEALRRHITHDRPIG